MTIQERRPFSRQRDAARPGNPDPFSAHAPGYVLIAEPDLKRAAFYRQVVSESDFDALVARDGEEAKEILRRRGAPVLLLAELSLPRLDGFGLLAELRRMADNTRTAAVVTSSFGDLRAMAQELRDKLGINEVIARNIPVRMLKAALMRAIETVVPPSAATGVDHEPPPPFSLEDDSLAQ